MVKFIKQTGLLCMALSAMLVLFTGCGGDDDDGGPNPLAQLEAKTVNCITTTDRLLTRGPNGQTFQARIVLAAGGEWCSFDPASRLATSADGAVGEALPLYLQENRTDEYRSADISVTYSGGYSVTLRLWQMPYTPVPTEQVFNRAWGELPEYREDADYIYKTYNTTLVGNKYYAGGFVRNFTVCYDKKTRVSQWVAYPVFYALYEAPQLSRVNAFGYDPNDQLPVIPTGEQQDITRGYGQRGYDRGHMLPQATRYNNYATNRMTYYATNMMPQNSSFNQGVWARLEGQVRQWGPLPSGTRYDTLYVVTGASFRNSTTIPNANGPIAVPSHCWKVLLKQTGNLHKELWELTDKEVKTIGFIFTNDAAGAATSTAAAACTVKEVETLSGFSFFQNLDTDVADAVKTQKNISDWPGIY